jgi:hypothetical protein
MEEPSDGLRNKNKYGGSYGRRDTYLALGKDRRLLVVYEGSVKSSSLDNNRRETRDKRPLGRDPDMS